MIVKYIIYHMYAIAYPKGMEEHQKKGDVAFLCSDMKRF